jgi:hypothetical protein
VIVELDISYESWVKPVQSNFLRIDLTEEEISLVERTAEKIATKKREEKGYLYDNDGLFKRWTTGLGGEVALGKHLGLKILDDRVGPSNEFDIGDLKRIGLDIGVKSVEYGKFPLVHVFPKRCEIILLKHQSKFRYMLCGLYTPDIMSLYSSRELVVDDKVRESKTAFYGIPFYKSFKTVEDLNKYCGVV